VRNDQVQVFHQANGSQHLIPSSDRRTAISHNGPLNQGYTKELEMTTSVVESNVATTSTGVDVKLEVVVIPVSDVDRAKEFYSKLGWRLDADRASGNAFRLVQFTPPGSGTSIQFGVHLTSAEPGSAQGLLLAVSDIEAARRRLVAQGVDATEVFHCETGTACRFPGIGVRVSGLQPERLSYSSFVSFSDPDRNGWLLQEVTNRLPGRVTGDTAYSSARELAEAMIRAAKAHGQHEARIGKADPNWPDWYAEYMVREQSGQPLPQ
jgi:catechol 2,3-dioxygenase-like lactoylglutathione lyase family enzyme